MSALMPEIYKIVNGKPTTTTNAAITGAYISLKNARRVTIVAEMLQAASHATVLGVNVATDVSGSGATALTGLMPVWKNADVSSSDTLVKASDAATIAASTGTTNQELVMVILPERMLPTGNDCIAATLTASSQATNFATITYYIETKYPQATPPAATQN